MRASGYYPSPIHGVSTMSSSTVLYGYARIQENLRSDPIEKLKRRPPLMNEGVMLAIASGAQAKHSFTRNGVEHEIVIMGDGAVHGWIDGVKQTSVGSLVPYVQTGEAADVDMVTINDTTFVLNRNRTVVMLSTTDYLASAVNKINYVNIIAALNYAEKVTVTVRRGGTVVGTVTHTVPDLGSTPDYDTADKARATDAVAVALANALAAQSTAWSINVWTKGSSVAIQDKSNGWVDIEVESGQGTKSAIATNKTIQTTVGLPLYAIVNSVITVKPDPTSEKGTYYLKAVRIADTASQYAMEEIVWSETRNPEEPYSIAPTTMPYTIVFSGGFVTTGQPSVGWNHRQTGNNTTCKVPKFVGQTIKRLGYMQTRLMVLTGSDCITTQTDDIYDFWKASAVKLLVTDPISMASNAVNIDSLEHLLPHNKDMLITGSNAQFKISGETKLGPDTGAMALTTSIEVDTLAKPVTMGNSIFFPVKQGSNAGIIEYTGEKDTTQDKGLSITDHITGMLKGRILQMVANSSNEMLIVQTDSAPDNVLYVYEQFTNEKGVKVQKSWSTWIFPETVIIRDIALDFNKLTVISLEGTDLKKYAVYIDSKVALDKDETIFLDNKLIIDTTGLEVTLPADYVWDTSYVCVQGEGCNYPLYQAGYTYDSDFHKLVLDEDVGAGKVHVGLVVGGVYQPNRPYRRNQDGRVLTEEKIRISNIYIEVSDSYELGVEVDSIYYDAKRMVFTNEVVGQAVVGQKTPFTGAHNYPFSKDADLANIKITTEGYLGLTVTSIRWRGQYTRLTTII